jgi:hypothetical protein
LSDQLDRSVWQPDFLATKYEDVFTSLWDRLRAAQDKLETLAQFDCPRLVLGELDLGTSLAHSTRQLHLTPPGRSLNADQWKEQVRLLRSAGYQLVDCEWRQASFDPGSDRRARSTIAIRLHVFNSKQQERIVVRGSLQVQWRRPADDQAVPVPEEIGATDLELVRQSEPAAFERVLTQEIATDLNPVFIDPLIFYDLNGDGLSEIILAGQNVVLWNLGGGTFRGARLCQEPVPSLNTAVMADFTGDGLPDLLGADHEGLILYVGGVGGSFDTPPRRQPITARGLPNALVLTAGDVDGDGALDVWLGQYKLPYVAGQMPSPYFDANDGFPSYLLLNDGHGNFRDATVEAGLGEKRFRRTYSASLVDLNGDGSLDLVVVSDFAGVDLYFNDGHGRFQDVTARALDEPHAFGMAHTFGDYDRDGALDFLVIGMNSYTAERMDALNLGPENLSEHQKMRAKMAHGNRLFYGRNGSWHEQPTSLDVARSGWSWGVTTFDFDNDGAQDIYIANGHKSYASTKDCEGEFWRHDIYLGNSTPNPAFDHYVQARAERLYGAGQSYGGHEKNRLFWNQDGKSFLEIGFLAGVAMPEDCRNVVSDDLDNDGQVDLVVTSAEVWPRARQRLHIFRNRLPHPGHWIGVRLRESRPGFSPIGAKITMISPRGTQFRQIVTGDSYRSQHAATAHFGLGEEAEVDALEVRWPNGKTQRMVHPAVDQYHLMLPEL